MPRGPWMMIGALGVAACAWACSSNRPDAPAPKRVVSAQDFSDPAIVRVPKPAEPIPVAQPGADATMPDVVAIVGTEFVSTAPDGVATGDRFVVDEMVGQINGKPIYADEFFQSMDAKLRETSLRTPLRQWIKDARADIEAKVWDVTRDELLLAEFRSTLTPEMKVGVLAFIESIRSDLIAGNLGSEEQANERTLEEEGVTLREKVKEESERRFVLTQLRKAIANRVYVSSRDIEQYYQQNYAKFNPPPIAVLTVIQVPMSEGDRIAARLAAGEAFATVAEEESGWAKDKQNQHRVLLQSGSVRDQAFWAPPALNAACQALEVGDITPRIDAAGSAWWCELTTIEIQPSKSLYEAQLEIEVILKGQRLRAEEQRYFLKLLAKSNVSDLAVMTNKLVEYAAVRYYVRPDQQVGG